MSIGTHLSRLHAPWERRVWQQQAWQAHRDANQVGATTGDWLVASLRTDFAWAQSLFAIDKLPENADLRAALRRARTPAPNRLTAMLPPAPGRADARAHAPRALQAPGPQRPGMAPLEPPLPSTFALLIGLGFKVLGFVGGALVFVPAACVRRALNAAMEYESRGVPVQIKLPEARVSCLQQAMERALAADDAAAQSGAFAALANADDTAATDVDAGSEPSDHSDPETLVDPSPPTLDALAQALAPLLPASAARHERAATELKKQPQLDFEVPLRHALQRAHCTYAPAVARLLRPAVVGQVFVSEVLGLRVDGHDLSPTAGAIATHHGQARYTVRLRPGAPIEGDPAAHPLQLDLEATLRPGTVAVGDEHAPVALRVPVHVTARVHLCAPLTGSGGPRFAVQRVEVASAPHAPLGLTVPHRP